MKWTSALAIYLLFWVMTVFFVLPIGMRTAREAGTELVPGQAEGAPAHFSLKTMAIRTTIGATATFAAYYLNYVNGWITVDDIAAFLPQA